MVLAFGSTPTIVFLLVDATDGETPETGLTPTVYVSKNGGTAATATNAAAEIDSTNLPGWYSLALTATETDTDGPLIVYADSGSTTKTWYDVHQVVTSVTAALSAATLNTIADYVLKRAFASAEASSDGDGGTSPDVQSLLGVIAKQMGRTKNNAGTLQIFESDLTTVWGSQSLTTGSGDPVTEVGGAS